MLQQTTTKLYNFIIKLLNLLEKELDNLDQTKNTIKLKKNIIDTLYKILQSLTQLNKLHQNSNTNTQLAEEDQKIINHFLSKYTNTDCN